MTAELAAAAEAERYADAQPVDLIGDLMGRVTDWSRTVSSSICNARLFITFSL